MLSWSYFSEDYRFRNVEKLRKLLLYVISRRVSLSNGVRRCVISLWLLYEIRPIAADRPRNVWTQAEQ